VKTGVAQLIQSSLGTLLLVPLAVAAVPSTAPAWNVQAAQSKLGFSGIQAGSTRFDGTFSRYAASIAFDPVHLESSHIGVTIELASARTGDGQRDNSLLTKDWFDVVDFPRARFETTAIRRAATGTYEAVGTLTIRDVTRPLIVPLTFQITGDTAHIKGHSQLTRTDFGIGRGPWANPQWVGVNVGIDVDLTAKRFP
jgi:polyisoprenoid-binding protein YceI